MNSASLEELFQRFRERGDTAALAEVFDRSAAELLKVGVHLTGDAAEAEDLVQATFLTAIERRASWDMARPLLPWLLGILGNGARSRRRQAGRTLDSERVLRPGPRKPEELAGAGELDEILGASIDRLPEEQRPVVVLHLRHGLPPADIAHALGRGPSTVRSQLQRGLTRLRETLPRGYQLSAAIALRAPRGLYAVRDHVLTQAAAQVTASVSTSTLVLTFIAMNKAVLILGAAALALAALFLLPSDPEQSGAAAPQEKVHLVEATAEEALLSVPSRAEVEERVAVAEPEVAEAPIAIESSSSQEPAAESRSEQAWFNLLVVDSLHNPIPRVEIEAYAIRGESGAHYLWPGEAWRATTDSEGRARIRYPRALSDLDASKELTAMVRHPDYQPLQVDLSVALAEGEVVLERGGFLAVSGWIGSRDVVITDVQPRTGFSSGLDHSSWSPLADGRPATTQLPPGRHELYLTHTTAGGELFHSDVIVLEFATGEERELHLELLPACTLEGELDSDVPRPVREGMVRINILGPIGQDDAQMHRTWDAEIRPDGRFTLAGLPPGRGQIIGACEGWVSRPLLPETDALDATGLDTQLFPGRYLQEFELVAGRELEFVLAMEASATIQVEVLGPDDQPLEGARVQLWPNVHWANSVSQIFLDREYQAVSDVLGRATVEGLPAGVTGWGLEHDDYQAPVRDENGSRTRSLSIRLTSGEITTTTAQMMPLQD
jgi:RNA polymerase sigma-70 factor (ECF subfamily)